MSLLKRLLDRLSLREHDIYLISDTHFSEDDLRIVCHRPFDDISDMDTVIAEHWNDTIRKDDTVYFLGDWGQDRWYWKKCLSGKILSVKGNHDHNTRAPEKRVLKTGKREYLLVHNPPYRKHLHRWVIHGHHHNNLPNKYPFINGYRKTINVCVELTDYEPISLNWLESLNLDSIKWMQTSKSTPERW